MKTSTSYHLSVLQVTKWVQDKMDKKYYKQAEKKEKIGNNQEISGQEVNKRKMLEGEN